MCSHIMQSLSVWKQEIGVSIMLHCYFIAIVGVKKH